MSHPNMQATAKCPLPPLDVIPQQEPFRFVDDIQEGNPGQYAVSVFEVKSNHPVFQGHFPGQPVWPGVLLIENMAQTACWVMASQDTGDSNDGSLYVLVRVNQCTFKRIVRPLDFLQTRAELSRDLGQFCIFDCKVTIKGEVVASAELLVAKQQAKPTSI